MNFVLPAKDGREIPLKVSVQEGKPSLFVFALHKSGSTLINKVVRDLAAAIEAPFVNVPVRLFKHGLNPSDLNPGSTVDLFNSPGVCFAGFREFPSESGLELPDTSRFIYLVRDPRDMAVSQYYSFLQSHPVPESGPIQKGMTEHREEFRQKTIDQYVIETSPLRRERIEIYNQKLLPFLGERGRIYRYEDWIFKKADWAKDICDLFGWDISEETITQIAQAHDLVPDQEDASQHVRRVVPGDHLNKLLPETIQQLNDFFRDCVTPLGYEL